MSTNEFIDKETAEKKKEKEKRKRKKRADRKSKREASTGRIIVRIMNGEFLSKDNFISNLPFTFFIAFLLVVMIGWGYYSETISKEEVRLEKELGELEAEYFTLSSEFNTRISRPNLIQSLRGTGVKESMNSPRKIKVKKYVFD